MMTVKILLLLFAVNGAPIILRKLLDGRYAWPVDGGWAFYDGRPLFGPSKTWRGMAGALLAGASVAWALGFGIGAGVVVGLLTMLGDLFSSFLKRRFGVPSSGMALGVDQVPESLFPLLWLKVEWDLGYAYVIFIAALFFVLELVISRVLYWLHIRFQPY